MRNSEFGIRNNGNCGLRIADCGFGICTIALLLGGCAKAISPVAEHVPRQTPARMDWSNWGLALSRHFSGQEKGGGSNAKGPLERFLALVSVVGPRQTPELFPNSADRLAYWINCYNAAMLVGRYDARGSPETGCRFKIDGGFCAPAVLRRAALAEAGSDWRVRMVLSDPSRAGPPLFRRPFLPDLLEGQLTEATNQALATTDVVNIAHGEVKRLLLWRGLYDVQDRLVADYEQRTGAKGAEILSVLLEKADADRRAWLNSAVGYRIEVMPEQVVENSLPDVSK